VAIQDQEICVPPREQAANGVFEPEQLGRGPGHGGEGGRGLHAQPDGPGGLESEGEGDRIGRAGAERHPDSGCGKPYGEVEPPGRALGVAGGKGRPQPGAGQQLGELPAGHLAEQEALESELPGEARGGRGLVRAVAEQDGRALSLAHPGEGIARGREGASEHAPDQIGLAGERGRRALDLPGGFGQRELEGRFVRGDARSRAGLHQAGQPAAYLGRLRGHQHRGDPRGREVCPCRRVEVEAVDRPVPWGPGAGGFGRCAAGRDLGPEVDQPGGHHAVGVVDHPRSRRDRQIGSEGMDAALADQQNASRELPAGRHQEAAGADGEGLLGRRGGSGGEGQGERETKRATVHGCCSWSRKRPPRMTRSGLCMGSNGSPA